MAQDCLWTDVSGRRGDSDLRGGWIRIWTRHGHAQVTVRLPYRLCIISPPSIHTGRLSVILDNVISVIEGSSGKSRGLMSARLFSPVSPAKIRREVVTWLLEVYFCALPVTYLESDQSIP